VCRQRCHPFPRLDSENSSLCSNLILQISNIVNTPYKKRSQKAAPMVIEVVSFLHHLQKESSLQRDY